MHDLRALIISHLADNLIPIDQLRSFAGKANPVATLVYTWRPFLDQCWAAIAGTNAHFIERGDAFEVIEAYEQSAQDRLWKLRKAVIPLLMSLDGDPKPYPFIEDATVPPAELAEYVQQFEAVLEEYTDEIETGLRQTFRLTE